MVKRLLILCLFFVPVLLDAQLACPDVDAGPDQTICPGQCANLTATFVATGQTNAYTVSQTPYTPYAFNVGAPVIVNQDDIWTGAINLPFTFCFYGNAYNQCVIGANGLISFNMAYAGQYCPWPINNGFPSAANPVNVIACPFHDIDPSIYGDIYVATYGVAPCRVFVVSWSGVAMFQCNNISSTQQIAIFETTNIIETYIQSKTLCPGWNGGAAIHGIQNANGTQAVVVPGRNFPAQWTATNDAWRFTPAGPSNVTVNWLVGGTPVGTGATINVCPPASTTYTAQAVYTNCNGTQVTVTDPVVVNVRVNNLAPTNTGTYCPGQTIQLNAGATAGTGTFVWTGPGGQVVGNAPNVSLPNGQVANAGTYTVNWTTTAGCTVSATTNVAFTDSTTAITGVFAICAGQSTTLTADPGLSYIWSNGETTQSINVANAGNYAVTVTNIGGCTATAVQAVTTSPLPTPAIAGLLIICPGDSTTLTASGGTGYLWNDGSTTASITENTVGVYSVTVNNAAGCTASATATLVFNPPLTVAISPTTSYNGFNISCAGLCDGAALANVSGGNGSYQYVWSNAQTTASIAALCSGILSVTATDGNGCSGSATINLTEPAPLTAAPLVSDATCFGLCNGSASISVNGGVTNYDYLWSNGGTANAVTNLCAGGYSVTATDANGCTVTSTVNIGQDPALVLVFDQTVPAACFGDCNGALQITASGGFPPYAYAWSNGDTNEDADSLCANIYSITLVDGHGCSQLLDSLPVNQPAPLNLIIAGTTNVSCFGAADGTVDLTVSGGTAPYTYLWSNGALSEDLSNLGPIALDVLVTDANGCQDSTNTFITEPVLLTAAATATAASCGGICDGALNLTFTGGTIPYVIAWSGGLSPIANPTGVCAGTYTATVTDANGCTATATATVTEPTPLQVLVAGVVPATCNGLCNGAIDLTVSGGFPGYTFAWSGGLPGVEDPSGLCAGSYDVTVTDANGCSVTNNAGITEPLVLSLVLANIADLLCNNQCIGAVNINTSGGTLPYNFIWATGQNTEDIAGLCAGNYNVTVTDANACSAALNNLPVNQPAVLTAVLTGVVDVTCNAACNGSIDITVAGGVLPYAFTWSGGLASVEDPTGVCAGTYTVTITDANGCSVSVANITLTEPTALLLSSVITNVTCNALCNGSIDVTESGGNAPYAFLWSNGATTEDIAAVCAGLYDLTLTDNNGCTAALSALTVTEPPVLAVQVDGVINLSCNNACDGAVQITVTGGTLPYAFAWNNGALTEDIFAICAGTYEATVTDANGCVTNIAPVVVTEPAPLAVTLDGISDVVCNAACDGSISLGVFGGVGPYSFNWSFPFGNVEDLVNVCAGTYSVTVTDANGCTATLGGLTVNEPTALLVTVQSVTDLSCDYICDGSIALTVNGGTPAYGIVWNNNLFGLSINNLCAGGYSVTVTDNNGCTASTATFVNAPPALTATAIVQPVGCFGASDGAVDLTPGGGTPGYTFLWSNAETTEDLAGLILGVYDVTLTDANGCTLSTSATVPEPAQIFLAVATEDAVCNGSATGSVDLSVVGGVSPFTFQWNNGPISEDLTGVPAGTYTVTATDANGCTETISATVGEPPVFVAAQTGMTPTLCSYSCDGNASVLASGGTPFPFGYLYLWNDGQTAPSALNLCAGAYTVTATDANSCTATFTVTVTAPTAITPTIATTPLSCYGGSDGTATASAVGGTPGYDYLWNTGNVGPFQVNLERGNVFVTVSDANGCTATISSFVGSPNPLSGNPTFVDAGCADLFNGAIALNPSGGTAPYGYLWSNGTTTAVIVGLGAGVPVSVTLTDANGCDTTLFALAVGEPLPIQLTATVIDDPLCAGGATGAAAAVAIGGTPNYIYEWDINNFGDTVNNLVAGTYVVTVTDANGCTNTDTVTLEDPTPVTGIFTATDVPCFGDESGTITVDSIGGGTGPYAVSIDGTTFFPNITAGYQFDGLPAGEYETYVSDLNGCLDTVSLVIAQPDEVLLYAGADTSIQLGDSIQLAATFDNAPDAYSLTWTPAGSLSCSDCLTPTATPIATTLYTLTWVDTNGCTGFDEVNVQVELERRIFIPTAFTPNDDGLNDVFMVYGGTGVVTIRNLQIYDRWGEQIFVRTDFFPNDPFNGWDGTFKGKMLNPGAFVYYVEAEFTDGKTLIYKGDVSLLR